MVSHRKMIASAMWYSGYLSKEIARVCYYNLTTFRNMTKKLKRVNPDLGNLLFPSRDENRIIDKNEFLNKFDNSPMYDELSNWINTTNLDEFYQLVEMVIEKQESKRIFIHIL